MATEVTPSAPSGKKQEREQFSGQFGFIVSAIGSAIGLGNIWRFPGVAYSNGGGAFLIPYLVALVTAGIPILLLDYSLGHRYRGSAPTVYRRLRKKFEVVGWLQVLVSFVITAYYAVILAWGLRYIFFSFNLAWGEDTTSFFIKDFLQLSDPGFSFDIVWGIFVPLLTIWVGATVVMALGITRGVEKLNRVFIPLLVVIFLALVIRAIFLDGALEGLNAFFTPNWSALTDPGVWVAAYSQIFFSLSVGFGIMLTYSSYLKKKSNIIPTGLVTGFANSSFEILAGIGVFATLGFMAAQEGVGVGELDGITGPILSFVTFPKVISMMPGGPLFGVIFFTSLVIAGFTSLISLLQVMSSALQEKFGWSTRKSSVAISVVTGTVSVLVFSTSNGLNALDIVDKYINEIGIVSCTIITTILVAYVLRRLPVLRAHLNFNSALTLGRWWSFTVAVFVPVVLGYILVATVLSLIKTPYGGYSETLNLAYGWLMLLGVVIASVILSLLKWRTPVDEYNPMEYHSPEAAGGHNDTPEHIKSSASAGSASSADDVELQAAPAQ